MDDSFVNLVEYKAGYAWRLFLKKQGSIPTLCVCEGNMVTSQRSVHTPSEIVLTAACVLKIHTSIIIVSITRLFPFRARVRGTTIMYSIWKIMCFWTLKACQHIRLHQIIIFKITSYDPFKLFSLNDSYRHAGNFWQIKNNLNIFAPETRVAKGRKFSRNIPWELRLGNFGNIPSLKLTSNVWEFTGINNTVPYTNININILFDHRLTCRQINRHFKNDFFIYLFGGGGVCDAFLKD